VFIIANINCITIKSKPKEGIWNYKFVQALILYGFFIISSRCDYRFLMLFIVCLAIDFFIHSHYSNFNDINPDNKNTQTQILMYKIANIFGIISIASLLIGFGISIYHKKNDQSVIQFIFGHHNC
jgi:purine-cytosine permease-like protein